MSMYGMMGDLDEDPIFGNWIKMSEIRNEVKSNDTDVEKKKFVVRNASDVQRAKLEKLMKNPDKPIIIPEGPKDKDFSNAIPSFIRNVMGSSAGAGSGEFHVYRHLRRKEYARQKNIQEKSRNELLDDEYHEKLERYKLEADVRTAKKRARRQKRRLKAKNKSKVPKTDESHKNTVGYNESESNDEEDESENEDDINSQNEDDKNSQNEDMIITITGENENPKNDISKNEDKETTDVEPKREISQNEDQKISKVEGEAVKKLSRRQKRKMKAKNKSVGSNESESNEDKSGNEDGRDSQNENSKADISKKKIVRDDEEPKRENSQNEDQKISKMEDKANVATTNKLSRRQKRKLKAKNKLVGSTESGSNGEDGTNSQNDDMEITKTDENEKPNSHNDDQNISKIGDDEKQLEENSKKNDIVVPKTAGDDKKPLEENTKKNNIEVSETAGDNKMSMEEHSNQTDDQEISITKQGETIE